MKIYIGEPMISEHDQDSLSFIWVQNEFASLFPKLRALIAQLEEQDNEPISTEEDKALGPDDPRDGFSVDEIDDLDLEDDLRLEHPRFPALVREFLDEGKLAELIDKYGPHNRGPPKKSANPRWSGHQYELMLIAVCAMQLGCTFPAGFISKLKTEYKRLEGAAMGTKSFERMCDEYINGKPMGLLYVEYNDEICENGKLKLPPLEPVPNAVPHRSGDKDADGEPSPKKRKIVPDTKPRIVEYEFWHPPGTCKNCGATEGPDGEPLKRCGVCKVTHYCFEGCQKWHWYLHIDKCEKLANLLKERREKREAETMAGHPALHKSSEVPAVAGA